MSELVHPEFPLRITAKIWNAAFRRLDIPRYRNFFTGGLTQSEVEELLLLEAFTPPALGVILGPIETQEHPSQRKDQVTQIELHIVWRPPRRPRDVQGALRARVIDDLRVTLSEDFGQLKDEDGQLLTEALTRFRRLQPLVAVPRGAPKYLLDRVRVDYRSFVGPDFQFEG